MENKSSQSADKFNVVTPPPPPKSNPLLEKDSLQLAKYLLSNNNTEYTTGAYLFIINMLKSLLDTNNNTVISFTNNE
jgi:hypothetical protein